MKALSLAIQFGQCQSLLQTDRTKTIIMLPTYRYGGAQKVGYWKQKQATTSFTFVASFCLKNHHNDKMQNNYEACSVGILLMISESPVKRR